MTKKSPSSGLVKGRGETLRGALYERSYNENNTAIYHRQVQDIKKPLRLERLHIQWIPEYFRNYSQL
jgi:hypothetical protein